MRSIKHTLQSLQDRRRRPKLPWAELEAEAARQACSPADIFFDWAGRPASAPPPGGIAPAPTLIRARCPVHDRPRSFVCPAADQVEMNMRKLAGNSARTATRSRAR